MISQRQPPRRPRRLAECYRRLPDSREISPEPTQEPSNERHSISEQQEQRNSYFNSEIADQIFYDSSFVESFLIGNPDRLANILHSCVNSPSYNTEAKSWLLPDTTEDAELRQPILDILNTIKRAVDRDGQLKPDTPLFIDISSYPISPNEADPFIMGPDLALFSGNHATWPQLRYPVEVKARSEDLRDGMLELTWDAGVVFGNQPFRRHLYGLIVCGSEATFVRFDRSGILHSPPIDIRTSSDEFTKAFSSLLLFDRMAEGYDTAFTLVPTEDGGVELYVDLPESAFNDAPANSNIHGPSGVSDTRDEIPTRRFIVMEQLYYRGAIHGRATTVFRIRDVRKFEAECERSESYSATTSGKKRKAEVLDEEVLSQPDYVLKLFWHNPVERTEGDVLKLVQGMYGLSQYVWHCEVPGECRCDESAKNNCRKCVDATPQPRNLERSQIMRPKEVETIGSDTKEERSNRCVRKQYVYSRIVMSSIGESLSKSKDVEEFLEAVLDAILGYWKLLNLGILHRDVSDGNVLLLREKQQYAHREWKEESDEDLGKSFGPATKSETELRRILKMMDRDPKGMLTDFDLHKRISTTPAVMQDQEQEVPKLLLTKRPKLDAEASASNKTIDDEKGETAHSTLPSNHMSTEGTPNVDYRTGTPSFMAARILRVEIGMRYKHRFMDDLESFFWVILYIVAERIGPGKRAMTYGAQRVLKALNQNDWSLMGMLKASFLCDCVPKKGGGMEKLLKSFRNDWASDPRIVSVILNMGRFFFQNRATDHSDPSELLPRFVNIILDVLHPRFLETLAEAESESSDELDVPKGPSSTEWEMWTEDGRLVSFRNPKPL